MARSLRSKRLQKNRGAKRKKYREREKKKMWEKADKIKEREEAAKLSGMDSDQNLQPAENKDCVPEQNEEGKIKDLNNGKPD